MRRLSAGNEGSVELLKEQMIILWGQMYFTTNTVPWREVGEVEAPAHGGDEE